MVPGFNGIIKPLLMLHEAAVSEKMCLIRDKYSERYFQLRAGIMKNYKMFCQKNDIDFSYHFTIVSRKHDC